MSLSILCVTRWDDYALPFLNEMGGLAESLDAEFVEYDGRAARCIEDVLDDAVAECSDGYILRLDDDERCSSDLVAWLAAQRYEAGDHWAFPRMNLWPDSETFIRHATWSASGERWEAALWPDYQTRLSVKAKSGGRERVHEGSPFGTGSVAPCAIEHHKFLVRDLAERRRLIDRYETLQPAAGSAFVPFSVPEDAASLQLETYGSLVTA